MPEISANPPPTQRRLILIRHAKAVDEEVAGDHARALSPRGLSDAAALGVWLKEQGLVPELVLCSTARRTRETLAALGNQLPTILSDKLYLASVGDMLGVLQATDDAVKTVAMVCHNPGAHALLAQLVGDYANEADADKVLLKFPTAACAVMDFNVVHWAGVAAHTATLQLLRA